MVFCFAVLVGVFETGIALIRPGDEETPGIPNPLGIEGPGLLTGVLISPDPPRG
jgi:hypothetical protein